MGAEVFEVVTASSLLGLVSHFVFRRYEPASLESFVLVVLSIGVVEHLALSFTLNEACLSITAFLLVLGVSILYYRVFSPTHPLHHIPGPLIARATQLYQFYSVFRGRPRVLQCALHHEYGPVVRIGPNEVSVSDTAALNIIYGGRSWEKGKSYSFTASGGAATSETALSAIRDHKEHAFRRKIWDRAFAIASLKNYRPSIEMRVQQLCDKLDHQCGKDAIDLQEWISYLVFDIMTDLAWGGGGDALLEGRDPDGAIKSLRHSLHLAGMTKALPWFARMLTTLTWIKKRMTKFHRFSSDMFLGRRARGKANHADIGRDVFHHLLGEGTAEGRQISMGALQADSRQVVTGGADTTVSAITYLFYHLASSPQHYNFLQKHLDTLASTLPNGKLTYESVQKSDCLDAYINEAMRLEPPIPYQNQRIVPPGGAQFSNMYIPPGTHVRTAIYAIGRSPSNFSEDSNSFRPKRWLPSHRPSTDTFNPKASAPFILGPYHCVGRNFAMAEMRWTVAQLVQRYDMCLATSFKCTEFEFGIEDRSVLEITRPLEVMVQRRSANDAKTTTASYWL